MAFIISGGNVVSYAEATNVRDKDQLLFEANEFTLANLPDAPPTLNDYIEDLTSKATARINQKIRASSRWREYLGYAGAGYESIDNIPAFNPNLILSRRSDFTDMCAYYTLKEYLLPRVADFGNPESAEVQKIQYYDTKFNDLFTELLSMMDWYDSNADGTVTDGEKMTRFSLTRRTRGRRSIVRTR
jgi:hypothetical protein